MVRPSSIALLLLMGNDHFLNLKMFSVNGHNGKGNLLVKAPPSTAAGVQPQNAIPLLTGVLVGVTVNHHIRIGKIRRSIPLIVNQEETDRWKM